MGETAVSESDGRGDADGGPRYRDPEPGTSGRSCGSFPGCLIVIASMA
ncbi:hypothetical protein [Arthrobacter methylotrophus]